MLKKIEQLNVYEGTVMCLKTIEVEDPNAVAWQIDYEVNVTYEDGTEVNLFRIVNSQNKDDHSIWLRTGIECRGFNGNVKIHGSRYAGMPEPKSNAA